MTSSDYRRRLLLVSATLLLCFGILFYRSAWLAFSDQNRSLVDVAIMARSPIALGQLNAHVLELENLGRNIDQYSLHEIRESLQKTAILVDRSNRELEAQAQAWANTRGRIKNDKVNYQSLRDELDEMHQLQDREIVRLKKIMDKAQKSSLSVKLWELLVTFALGIVSTLLTPTVYQGWKFLQSKLAALIGKKAH